MILKYRFREPVIKISLTKRRKKDSFRKGIIDGDELEVFRIKRIIEERKPNLSFTIYN
jgi:hypothetical protein